jgi:transposase InsO family protein
MKPSNNGATWWNASSWPSVQTASGWPNFTYMKTHVGFVYLRSLVLDVLSRFVVGWPVIASVVFLSLL